MKDATTKRRGLSKLPDEIARRKSIYVEVFAATGSAEAAIIAAGYSPHSIASALRTLSADTELMARAREARDTQVNLDIARFRKQQEELRAKADDAIKTLAEIQSAAGGPTNPKWHHGAQARVQAAIAILDRAGHKPIERVEQTVHWDDVSREMGGIDASVLFSVALAELRPGSEPLPGEFRALPHDAPADTGEPNDA